jgi:hypothetical protein
MPDDSMSEFTKPVEELGRVTREYVDLRVDDLKLRAVKGLSMSLGKLLLALLFLTVISIVLLALAFGGVLLLGNAVGSYAMGAFLVAGFFAIVLLALFLLRKRLFRDTFVPLFVKLFFDD